MKAEESTTGAGGIGAASSLSTSASHPPAPQLLPQPLLHPPHFDWQHRPPNKSARILRQQDFCGQHFGFGAQQRGLGVQHFGFGAQHFGLQHLLNRPANKLLPQQDFCGQHFGFGAQHRGLGVQHFGFGAQHFGFGAQHFGLGAQQRGLGAQHFGWQQSLPSMLLRRSKPKL